MLARLCLLILLELGSGTASSQQKGNPALPCYQALAGDARFAPLRDKVALGGDRNEMRRMTKSADRASAQEGAALAAWRNARAECHKQELPYFATRDTRIQALAREHFAAVQALIAELQAGALSYGEFGRRRIDLVERVTARIEEVRQGILPPKIKPLPVGQ